MSIDVLIVDDHEVVRTGLQTLFRGSTVNVVAQASNASDAVTLAVKHRPDIVLLDIRMEEESGFSALDRLKDKIPDARVIILSTHNNPTYVARAAALGASDFVLKGSSRRDLIATIEAVASGDGPTKSGAMRAIAATMQSNDLVGDDIPLTHRESQVLRHIALGLSNKEIARSLTISVETVKEHVQNILRKVNCTDRTQAAVWAVRRSLV
jgi:DNA-binding NarL/FixJ family response regulator